MRVRNLLKKTETLPFVFFIINVLFKLIYIDAQDICIDEPFTIYHAQFAVRDIVEFLKPTNNPPLFEIVLHFWIKVFGISAYSVRFLPVIFASGAVIFVYKIAVTLFNKPSAITAACMFTFSNYVIFYSHDCRAYSLFLLLTVASFYYLIKIINGDFSIKYKVLYCVLNVMLVYCHYFGFIVWIVQAIYVIMFFRKNVQNFFVLFGISLLLYAPQIIVFFQRTSDSARYGTWITNKVNAESLYNKIVLFGNMPVVALLCLAFLLLYVIKKLVTKNKPRTNEFEIKNEALIIIWFFIPLLMLFFISFKIPVFLDRYLVFISPAFYIMMGFIVNSLLKNKYVEFYISTALILGFALTMQLNPDKKREVKRVVEYIKGNKGKKTLVIICAHDFINNFTYYYDKKIFSEVIYANEYNKMTYELNWQNIYPVRTIDEIPTWRIAKAGKIIYLDAAADFSNPGNRIYETLKSTMVEKSKKEFRDIFTVYEFKKD